MACDTMTLSPHQEVMEEMLRLHQLVVSLDDYPKLDESMLKRLCAARLTLDTGGELPQLDGRTFEIKCPF